MPLPGTTFTTPLCDRHLGQGWPLASHNGLLAIAEAKRAIQGRLWDQISSLINLSGLRSKEALVLEQGIGIWSYNETQLSAAAQSSCSRTVKSMAKPQLESPLRRTCPIEIQVGMGDGKFLSLPTSVPNNEPQIGPNNFGFQDLFSQLNTTLLMERSP